MASIASRTHAIIVGVDKYENLDISFERAIKDAKAMRDILIKLGVEEKNIETFEQAESATKQGIMDKVASLKEKANRRDPIIFYYSGYVGTTDICGRSAGMICPYDVVSHEGGIPDIELVQMFHSLTPWCANNISVFLDCPTQNFDFDNPMSCVIMGPDEGATTEAGGAFTQAIIKVLSDIHDKQQPLDYMTVRSFSAHVQANIQSGNCKIRCTGQNVDRPLFNLTAEKGHYAFVTGHAHTDGRISLSAGAMHGIRPNAVYGIYNTNTKSHLDAARIGELRVDTLNKDDLTATLQSTDLRLPPIFYAVEERGAFDPLRIDCTTGLEKDLEGHSGWKKVSDPEKPIAILEKVKDGIISMTWKGLQDDEHIRGLERRFPDVQEADIQPMILRAARFYSQLAEPSPISLSPTKVFVRLQKVEIGHSLGPSLESQLEPEQGVITLITPLAADVANEEANRKNLLNDKYFTHKHVFLHSPWKAEDNPASYALTIINKNGFDVWLYVYLFDTEGLTIEPCYEASPATPLKNGKELIIGTGDDATFFYCRDDKDYDFIYLKIFVARSPIEIGFIKQSYSSQSEDKLRCFTLGGQQADKKSSAPSDILVETSPFRSAQKRGNSAKWASMTIRIINDYTSKV